MAEGIAVHYEIHTVLINVLVWQNMECFTVKIADRYSCHVLKGLGGNEDQKWILVLLE
jgi:hypothetical protein